MAGPPVIELPNGRGGDGERAVGKGPDTILSVGKLPAGSMTVETTTLPLAVVHQLDLGDSRPLPLETTSRAGYLATKNSTLRSVISQKDGRLGNPIPSKLQRIATPAAGSFSRISLDLNRPQIADRSAAAKRTSQNTAAVAAAARKRRCSPHSRQTAPSQSLRSKHQASPLVQDKLRPASIPRTTEVPSSTPNSAQQPDPSPQQSKAEQARLLTLLRSLNPNIVVDQLCKGLVYFGGVPEAPLPTRGAFPSSACNNGSGDLFISWIAELFPPQKEEPIARPVTVDPISAERPPTLTLSTRRTSPALRRSIDSRPTKFPALSNDHLPSRPTIASIVVPPHASDSEVVPEEPLPVSLPKASELNEYLPELNIEPSCLSVGIEPSTEKPKKKRGRPWGSKSTITRKDKGMKRGPWRKNMKATASILQPVTTVVTSLQTPEIIVNGNVPEGGLGS